MLRFKRLDFIGVTQGQANVIKTIGQAIFAVRANLELKRVITHAHQLLGQINRDLKTHVGIDEVDDFIDLCGG